MFLDKYSEVIPEAQVQIVDGVYNCVGMIFASRRTIIQVKEIRWILEEDDFVRLPNRAAHAIGDVVLYEHVLHGLTHVGIISCIENHPNEPMEFRSLVLSKWGNPGAEYIHPIDKVPADYGAPVEYWRHKRHHEAP
jgi:hypothetical protein